MFFALSSILILIPVNSVTQRTTNTEHNDHINVKQQHLSLTAITVYFSYITLSRFSSICSSPLCPLPLYILNQLGSDLQYFRICPITNLNQWPDIISMTIYFTHRWVLDLMDSWYYMSMSFTRFTPQWLSLFTLAFGTQTWPMVSLFSILLTLLWWWFLCTVRFCSQKYAAAI